MIRCFGYLIPIGTALLKALGTLRLELHGALQCFRAHTWKMCIEDSLMIHHSAELGRVGTALQVQPASLGTPS